MAKHSPGPWEWWTSNSWKRLSADGIDGAVLCPVVAPDGHPDLRISEANARLIAAAPDLLAALKKAERYVWEVACETEDGVHTLREDLPEAKLWKEIVAAISKAEGKDHD